MKGGCSVAVVTFMSRDLWNHVLCRVRHLVNRFVVFLESRVFSSLVKLLQKDAVFVLTSSELLVCSLCLNEFSSDIVLHTK